MAAGSIGLRENHMGRSSGSSCHSEGRPCQDLKILLIDSDESFRGALAGNLREDGHEVTEYAVQEALPPLATLEGVGLVLTDYQPSERGLAFVDVFHTLHPTTPVVLVTAFWSHHLEAELARRNFLVMLRKPFDYDDLHELVHRLTAHGAK